MIHDTVITEDYLWMIIEEEVPRQIATEKVIVSIYF